MANILQEVQDYVVGKLSADNQLSCNCTFLAENRKDIDYEIKNALGRQGIVGVVMTPKATYAGKYEDLFLAWQLDELEIDIVENVTVNRGKKDGYMTGQDVGLRVFDVLCPLSGDDEGQFCPKTIEEGEDSGLIVNKCILKALVYGDSTEPPGPQPHINMTFVKLLEQQPTGVSPRDGWMWPADGGFVIWQDGQQHVLGNVTFNAMSAYVAQELSGCLSAEMSGPHDEYATVRKIVEIVDPRSQSNNEPVLVLAQNGTNRSLEIIDTDSLATLNFGVLSTGVPRISFGIDDPETFNTLHFPGENGTLATKEWAYRELSGKANTNDLSSYLPRSGGTMFGTIGFEPDADEELGYKLIQLNPTGEFWQMAFGVDDNHGQPYVAHNGSETGSGEYGEYSWKLFFPDENGTLATQEWTYGELSGKVDPNDLSAYLPLSGGTLCGSIDIPTQYDLSVGTWKLQDKDLNGFQIGDRFDFWKFSGSTERPQDVMRRMDISAFPTTDEISATRVETMTTIHESDWADISASASSSTLYIVIPD